MMTRVCKLLMVGLATVMFLSQSGLSEEKSDDSDDSIGWEAYKEKFDKHYGSEEDAERKAKFLATKAQIERHNANAGQTFKMGLNKFSDWSEDELAKLHGVHPPQSPTLSPPPSSTTGQSSAATVVAATITVMSAVVPLFSLAMNMVQNTI